MARVDPFSFTKSWRKDEGLPYFPRHESSETKVRADMQFLFNEIKDFINGKLLGAVNTINAADITVTSESGTEMLTDKLGAIDTSLENLDEAIKEAVIGTIPDDSITGDKIIDGEITGNKIGHHTVEQANLAEDCVDTPMIVDSAVTAAKLDDNSVITSKIHDESITLSKLTPALQTAVAEKYAVGDIFITTRVGNPYSLLGYGTWERIEDRFLLAAGTRTAGTTGGEETHTLTVDEMPNHSHRLGVQNEVGSQTGGSKLPWALNQKSIYYGGEDMIETTGGGAAHNNMPPFYVVNMWLRTA